MIKEFWQFWQNGLKDYNRSKKVKESKVRKLWCEEKGVKESRLRKKKWLKNCDWEKSNLKNPKQNGLKNHKGRKKVVKELWHKNVIKESW